MADLNARIIAKASATAGEAPQAADLDVAELAVNTADGKLYTKHTDGSVKLISRSSEAGDPYWSSVRALVSFDNFSDGATSGWSNIATNPYGISFEGSPAITTSVFKWDSSSVNTETGTTTFDIDLTGNNLGAPSGTANDFTFEGWIYFDNTNRADAAWYAIVGGQASATHSIQLQRNELTDGVDFRMIDNVPNVLHEVTTPNLSVNNSWTHIAITREVNVYRAYWNGAKIAEFTDTNNYSLDANEARMGWNCTGMDDVRLTVGVARYVDNSFVLPTEKFAPPSEGGVISDNSDVDTATNPPTDGQVLTWVDANNQWEPADPTGGNDAATGLPSVNGWTINSDSTQATSQDLDAPGHSAGNLLIACIMSRDTGGTLTPPSGWTLHGTYLSSIDFSGTSQTISVFTKTATSSEPANYTWTQASSSRICGFIAAVAGSNSISSVLESYGVSGEVPTISTVGDALNITAATWVYTNTTGTESYSQSGTGLVEITDSPQEQSRISGGYTTQAGIVTSNHETADEATETSHGIIRIALYPVPSSINDNDDVDTETTPPTDGQVLTWVDANSQWEPADTAADSVTSVNGETGEVSLGVYELDDTDIGGYAAPAKGSGYPSTGIAYTNAAGGGGAWGTASVYINRNDGTGTIDNTDYSYLVDEEIRIYQTDASGVPNGTTWTVTALTYETGTDGDGWYGFTFASQGAAPTGTYYFRIGVGVLPVDGTVLTYDGTTETWKAVAPATSLITSVNGQTGVVSLGIQDMNDYALVAVDGTYELSNKVADTTDDPDVLCWNVMNDGTKIFLSPDETYLRSTLSSGDEITLSVPGLATPHTATLTTNVVAGGGNWYEFSLSPAIATSLILNAADGTPLTISSSVFSGTTKPLANGDILKWNSSESKFQPAPQVAIADGSTTGSVLHWDGTEWTETNAVVDGSGDINLGALGDVDLTVAATDKDSLVYEASSGTWKAVNMDPSNPLTVVTNAGALVNITSAEHQQVVRATGAGASVAFGAGVEGEYAYVVNNTGGDLVIGGSISTADNLVTVKNNGTIEAYYANSTWNVAGDLYTPGASFSYTLEGATDYTAPGGGKSDGDVITWDATNGYWSASSVTGQVSTYLSGTATLQDLSNVTLSSALDNQYLVYDSASGNWISEQLDTSGITQEVQLNTNLDDLANVLTSGKADGDLLSWDNDSNAWVPSSAGGGIDGKADKNMAFRPTVGDYQLIEDDNNKLVEITTPAVVTLPSGLSTGFQCVIMRTTTGSVSLSGTILSAGTTNEITSQYGAVTVVHKGSGTWYAFGDLS